MKALTLHRPWTELVLRGGKMIENRPWSTPHRGPLLIHGGKSFDDGAVTMALGGHVEIVSTGGVLNLGDDCPTGLLGTVDVVGICGVDRVSDALFDVTCDCGPWAFPGQYHWQLANPRPFREAVPCRGFQQLWTPPADVLDQVGAVA